jgi:hypothetical protein
MVAMCQTVKKMFDTAAYIDSLDMFGIRLGLAATEKLMEQSGHPEKNLRFIFFYRKNFRKKSMCKGRDL